MIKIKYGLYAALFIILIVLWNAWQVDHPQKQEAPIINQNQSNIINSSQTEAENTLNSVSKSEFSEIQKNKLISVKTDVFDIEINPEGGNIVNTTLTKYTKTLKNDEPITLLNDYPETFYIIQNGLIQKNKVIPVQQENIYQSQKQSYELTPNKSELDVVLTTKTNDGLAIEKIYSFKPGSYEIGVTYTIKNDSSKQWIGNYFMQITRANTPPAEEGYGVHSFFGFAVFDPNNKYQQYTYAKLQKNPLNQNAEGGWVANVEHYFLTAWIPERNQPYRYYSRTTSEGYLSAGMIGPMVELDSGKSAQITSNLYIGPKIESVLNKIAPLLSHTIDFGILWVISILLFKLLKFIDLFVHNWGWSIIIVTILIKAAFYHLSTVSYKSMAAMRKLQPKMAQLKERFKDDKQGMSKAMMELYKKEKVNPLGGCLPILIQIPVFIALYWVLLESVELRHAPWILWIHDLSAKDPYYILPIIMGITMFIQQKISPQAPDPTQAKMMMLMPIVMTALFLWFPSGLVLYWVVNNILSVAQQYYIMKKYEHGGFKKIKTKS